MIELSCRHKKEKMMADFVDLTPQEMRSGDDEPEPDRAEILQKMLTEIMALNEAFRNMQTAKVHVTLDEVYRSIPRLESRIVSLEKSVQDILSELRKHRR